MNTENGQLSLVDCVDELILSADPPNEIVSVEVNLTLGSSWLRNERAAPEQGWTRFSVLSPTGKNLATARAIEIDLNTAIRVHTSGRIEALPIQGLGLHTIVVEMSSDNVAWVPSARLPLDIRAGELDKKRDEFSAAGATPTTAS